MADNFNTTFYIDEQDRNYYVNSKYSFPMTEVYNSFQRILQQDNKITEQDLDIVYKRMLDKYSVYRTIWNSLNTIENKYYISSPLYKYNGSMYVDISCIYNCGEQPHSTMVSKLNSVDFPLQKCRCQYEKIFPLLEEKLKQEDEVYQKYSKQPIRGLYQVTDIKYKRCENNYNYFYIIKCLKCGKETDYHCSAFRKNIEHHTEERIFTKNPPCDCEGNSLNSRRDRELQEVEKYLVGKDPNGLYYLKDSIHYQGKRIYYIYRCRECGETICSLFFKNKGTDFICKPCSASNNFKEAAKQRIIDNNQVPWSDEEYFNKNILNNPTFFQNGKFIATEFTDCYDEYQHKFYKFKCTKCNHVFLQRAKDIFSFKVRNCPECEQNLPSFLVCNTIKLLQQLQNQGIVKIFTREDTINTYGHNYRFDFRVVLYNNQYFYIECDGEQHFSGWGHSEESLRRIIHRDNMKNKYILENNLCLVRIPYTYEYVSNIASILKSFLQWFTNSTVDYKINLNQPIIGNDYLYDFVISQPNLEFAKQYNKGEAMLRYLRYFEN